MQTPEPMLRMNATKMPFYAGRTPSSAMASPSRIPSVGPTTNSFGMMSPAMSRSAMSGMSPGGDRMYDSPSRQGRTPSRLSGGPPSAFKDPTSRPTSAASASARAGAATPLPGLHGGFKANRLDELDMALAKLLDEVPNDILVERVTPPLRKGQHHEGEWRARYALTSGRTGRKEHELRLLDLNKPGTGPGGKTRKIMIKDGNGEFRSFPGSLDYIMSAESSSLYAPYSFS